MGETSYRIEKDSMGEMKVPEGALYGAQTQRAAENFVISGIRFPRAFIQALGIVKHAAAGTNSRLGLLDAEREKLISSAAKEVQAGKLDDQFILDIFQTGSGTSSNMNANEVIARRAGALSGGKISIHPNDHVNMSQSSNDVIPTAIHIAVALQLNNELLPRLSMLLETLDKKSREFDGLVKTGRTHFQDATPIRLGQEFGGYSSQVKHGIDRVLRSLPTILELPLGGTAVGTGINTHPDFPKQTIAQIASLTGLPFVEAENHFEAQGARDALVEMSGQLRTVACSLIKIGNDLRFLSCGPRCGIGELMLPEVQPGSSIMPGKVNPVIIESLLMAMAQVIGNDTVVSVCGHSGGNLELHVMMPVMAHNILQSISLLANSAENFAKRCVEGIKPNTEQLARLAEASIATCTALAPIIGYDKAAELAKEAFKTGKSLRELAKSKKILPDNELDRVLDLMRMTKPGL